MSQKATKLRYKLQVLESKCITLVSLLKTNLFEIKKSSFMQ